MTSRASLPAAQPAQVAQIFNLVYRRFAIGKLPQLLCVTPSGCQATTEGSEMHPPSAGHSAADLNWPQPESVLKSGWQTNHCRRYALLRELQHPYQQAARFSSEFPRKNRFRWVVISAERDGQTLHQHFDGSFWSFRRCHQQFSGSITGSRL